MGFKGKVDFPASLTIIGESAFENCAELTDGIDLSSATGLESIGNRAFKGCNKMDGNLNLAGLTSLETIGDSAFEESKLKGMLGLADLSGLKTIGNSAFKNAQSFVELQLPRSNALTSIGESAFEGCKKLATGDIDSSNMPNLETIGKNAFKECKALSGELDLSNLSNLRKIEEGAFENCANLTLANGELNLTSSKKLQFIGNRAFRNCTSLQGQLSFAKLEDADLKEKEPGSDELVKRLETIGDSAFENCNLTGNLDLSGEICLKTIGECAFNVEDAVKESRKNSQPNYRGQFTGYLRLPDSLTAIDKKAFYENGFVDEKKSGKVVPLKLPKSLETIGEYAFKSREDWNNPNDGIIQMGNENGISQLDASNATNLHTIEMGAFMHCVFNKRYPAFRQ